MQIAAPILLKQELSKKVILGFVALASAAIIGTVGIAGASHKSQSGHTAPAAVGYGGTSVETNTNISAEVNGNNNVVQFFVTVYNVVNVFN